jgi:hypothetical protein
MPSHQQGSQATLHNQEQENASVDITLYWTHQSQARLPGSLQHQTPPTTRSAFVHDYSRKVVQLPTAAPLAKKVSFGNLDYGYGEHSEQQEHPAKRRRIQRRNSKTPAMLMAIAAKELYPDFLESLQPLVISDEGDDDNWDGGLLIAVELVKSQQQQRRLSGPNPVV